MKHIRTARITAFLLSFLLLLPICIPPVTVAAADTVPAAQILLSEDNGVLTASLQLCGADLARTQCLSLSFDTASLTLLANDGTAAVLPAQMNAVCADDLVVPSDGWSAGLERTVSGNTIPTLELGTASDGRGLILCYPTAETPLTYTTFTTVLTLRFAVDAQTAPTPSSLRLFSYAEQEQTAQSVKLLLCTGKDSYAYGSLAGNDTLPAPVFSGHPVINGAADNDSVVPNTPWRNPFTDITEDVLYYDAIAYVAQKGLFVGDDQNRFLPQSPMNRATFATVLCRLAGDADALPAVGEDIGFSDVRTDDWFAPYVAWAVEHGIFLGYGDGRFGPDDPITHEQMYLLMQRFTETRDYNVKPYRDVALTSLADTAAISAWALDAVRFAFANGLLIADAARTIRPTQDAARWELAVLLQSLSEVERTGTALGQLVNTAAADDIPQAPPAAESQVHGAVQTIRNGMMTLSQKINISAFRLNREQFDAAYHEAAKQPEFFYVDNLYYYTYSQLTGEILTVTPTYTMRGTELREAQSRYTAALNELLSGVDPHWSELEKVLYLHDLLATRYIYDETLGTFDALSLMTGKRGVCQAYTLVMQACLNALGIANSRVTSIEMNHTWNLVYVGGHWYHLDVTWDDPRADQHGQVQHVFFLKSDAYMRQNRHYNWTCFDGIQCTDTTYDNAFFNEVRTPIVSGGDGYYYYISNVSGAIFRWDPKTDTRSRMSTTDIRWSAPEGVYQSMYTGLVRIDRILLYNSSDAIMAYHLDTGITETIHKTTVSGYICGLSLTYAADSTGREVPYLIYQVRSSPAAEEGTLYRISAANLFTYTVTASVQGYFADGTAKVSLVRNGTTYKTVTLPRTDVFGECIQTFSIDGVRGGRYDLVIEKKNCLPCTVKNIDVSSFTNLTAAHGPLLLLCGDINGDGVINDTDRALLLHHTTFRRKSEGAMTPGADISGDGIIDIVDYAILTEDDRFGYTREMCIVTHAS